MNSKTISGILVLVVIGMALTGIGIAAYYHKQQAQPSDGIRVAASFFPLAHFAQQVGGNHVSVIQITPNGIEPHEYDPTPQDIVTLTNADLIVLNGNGVDAWAEKGSSDAQAKGVTVIKMSDHIQAIQSADVEGSTTVEADPHFWLDPIDAKQEIIAIRDAFIKIDPTHSADYQANAASYMQSLDSLDTAFREGLSTCTRHDIVVSHNAFNYLALEYGLTVHSIAGLSPESEPSSQALAQLSDLVKEKGIQYVFTEPLTSSSYAETISSETGVQMLVLNPLEGLDPAEAEAGKTYLSVMRDNLANLRTALACQ